MKSCVPRWAGFVLALLAPLLYAAGAVVDHAANLLPGPRR